MLICLAAISVPSGRDRARAPRCRGRQRPSGPTASRRTTHRPANSDAPARQHQRRQRRDVNHDRGQHEPDEEERSSAEGSWNGAGSGMPAAWDGVGALPRATLRSSASRSFSGTTWVSTTLARYFAYSVCSSFSVCGSRHHWSEIDAVGLHRPGLELDARHLGGEFGQAARHVIARRHDDEAVIAMALGPGRGLGRVAMGVGGRKAQIGAAIEARPAMGDGLQFLFGGASDGRR